MYLSVWDKIKRRYLRRGPKYTTNFVKSPQGNGIRYGQELIVRINGAEVVTGRLYDPRTKKTYQIDQSHKFDEDNDAETTNFTMKSRLHPDAESPDYFLPKGEYTLLSWYWDNDTMRGGSYRDKFVIF